MLEKMIVAVVPAPKERRIHHHYATHGSRVTGGLICIVVEVGTAMLPLSLPQVLDCRVTLL